MGNPVSASPDDPDALAGSEAFEQGPAALLLGPSGAIEAANRAARDGLRVAAGASLSSLVAVLGLSAVQWVLGQLRQDARQDRGGRSRPEAPTSGAGGMPRPIVGPRATLVHGAAVRLYLVPHGASRWVLGFDPVEARGQANPPGQVAAPASAAQPPGIALQALQRMFWDSPFPVWIQDGQFRLLDLNPAMLAYVGMARADLVGRDPIALLHPDDRDAQLAARRQMTLDLRESAVTQVMERRLVAGGGQVRWFRAVSHAVEDERRQHRWITVLQDCTAEMQARETAERSALELEQWFDLSPVGMMLFDEDGTVVRSNPALLQLIGPVPASLAQAPASLQDLIGWYSGGPLAGLQPGSAALLRHGEVEQGDEDRVLRAVVRCMERRGPLRRYMCVLEDRTAEEQLDKAQSQLGALVETAHAGLAVFDAFTGRFEPSQAAVSADAGASLMSSELRAIGRELVRSDTMAEFDRVQRALRNGDRTEARYAIQHPELGLRWLLTRVEPRVLSSGRRSASVVTLDVTEQHLAQQRSERLLRELTTILDSSSAGIAYLRGDLMLRYNRQLEHLLGLPPDAAGRLGLTEALADPDVARRVTVESAQALAESGLYETEVELRLPQRPVRWCALSIRRMDSPGPELESIAVLSDVTRLKLQQVELEAVARDRELMFSVSDVGIAFIRRARVQRANEGLALLSGYSLGELSQMEEGLLFAGEWDPEDLPADEAAALQRDGRWTGERVMRCRDGALQWVQVSKRLVQEGEPDEGVIASYVNVDARHRAEQALVTQAERTRAILDSVFVGIVTVGPQGIEWMNRSARRMFGGELGDFIGRPISVVATQDTEHPFRDLAAVDRMEEGQTWNFECEVRARDGRNFWVVGNAVLTDVHPDGRDLTYALLDIDSRRQAERRIADAQASLQRIIELAPLSITLYDARTLRILQINQAAATLAGRPADGLIGRVPEEVYPPDVAAVYRADMDAALAGDGVTTREYRIELDGEPGVWEARYLPLAKPGAAPDQLLMVATNVTEQRAAQEARLEAAISQRELLVKEVHHRIKNNLQGVAGLLQQIAARKPEMASAISEVAGQVQAIAHVYGLQVGAVGPLRLRRVVEAITGSVQRTFDRTIVLDIAGEHVHEWALPEAESIPIALTLNELLTNAIKHSQAGDVDCRLACEADAVQIEVTNAGRLPEGFSLGQVPGGVSGLGLIRALLPRRSARLTLENVGDRVRATVRIVPPGVTRLDPL